MPKITKKKLVKPIHTIIDIKICSNWDKVNGNTYHSAQITVNFDYENRLFIPCYGQSVGNMEYEAIKLLKENFKGMSKLSNRLTENLNIGVLITSEVFKGNFTYCKRFGDCNEK
jgi:hypothetical protein